MKPRFRVIRTGLRTGFGTKPKSALYNLLLAMTRQSVASEAASCPPVLQRQNASQ